MWACDNAGGSVIKTLQSVKPGGRVKEGKNWGRALKFGFRLVPLAASGIAVGSGA